jgi:hypothetical protein
MVESFAPATNNSVRLTNGIPNTFDLTTLVPSTHALSLQWFTNNTPVLGATSSVFTVTGFDLPLSGTNLVRVDVADPTTLVRAAPTNMMMTSVTWKSSFVAARPRISISIDAGQTTLNWPETAAGLYLEQTTNLLDGYGWTPLLLVSNQTGVAFPPANPQSFFRLHRP